MLASPVVARFMMPSLIMRVLPPVRHCGLLVYAPSSPVHGLCKLSVWVLLCVGFVDYLSVRTVVDVHVVPLLVLRGVTAALYLSAAVQQVVVVHVVLLLVLRVVDNIVCLTISALQVVVLQVILLLVLRVVDM
eukprot:373267-Amphidinium_carterae.1